ncbi:MAG: hypothetical protein IID33_02635, partial [Planctomycetes bacterium]|nr:hypothetical protein [Planctomycetota bacterium]
MAEESASLYQTVAKIVPAKAFQEMGADEFVNNPIGTGPYRLKELRQNAFHLYEAFPESWRGAPKTQFARIVKIPEAASLVAAAKTGEVDLAYDIPADLEDEVNADPNLSTINFVRLSTHVIDLNYQKSSGIPEFENILVRHAINYAVDQDAINTAVSGGRARISNGQLVTEGITGYNPNLKPYPFDLDKAKSLMAEAGAEDGFSAEMLTTRGTNGLIGEAVAGFLHEINIDVSINSAEFPVFLQTYLKGDRGAMFLWGTGFANFMDASEPMTFFVSTQRPQIKRMDVPEYDDLMAQAKVELDPDKRDQFLQDAAVILREEAPLIFLFNQ